MRFLVRELGEGYEAGQVVEADEAYEAALILARQRATLGDGEVRRFLVARGDLNWMKPGAWKPVDVKAELQLSYRVIQRHGDAGDLLFG